MCSCEYVSMLISGVSFLFFFNDTATTEIYTLSLHDALPIFLQIGFYCGFYSTVAVLGSELADLLNTNKSKIADK